MSSPKKRALVIDDEEPLRAVISDVLNMVDIETVTASSGFEALKIASDPSNHFDIIIIDMYMPKMTGDETYEKLREFYPDCPVLFISGLETSKQQDETNPKRQFLKKPFAVKNLQNAIKKMIDPTQSNNP